MTLKQWLAVGVLASMPYAASAQPSAQQPDPHDANATVSASGYESAFKNYQAAADEQESPNNAWRAANDEVAKLGGHAGHMKDHAPSSSAPPESAPLDHSKHH
jgi:hypothetical protein